jgi:hypothetical protein
LRSARLNDINMSNMKPKSHKAALRQVIEKGSVRFDRVEDVKFWLTPENKIFLVRGEMVGVPFLNGSVVVSIDNPEFELSEAVKERCRTLLKQQRQIRQGWPTPEEEKDAWNWS